MIYNNGKCNSTLFTEYLRLLEEAAGDKLLLRQSVSENHATNTIHITVRNTATKIKVDVHLSTRENHKLYVYEKIRNIAFNILTTYSLKMTIVKRNTGSLKELVDCLVEQLQQRSEYTKWVDEGNNPLIKATKKTELSDLHENEVFAAKIQGFQSGSIHGQNMITFTFTNNEGAMQFSYHDLEKSRQPANGQFIGQYLILNKRREMCIISEGRFNSNFFI